MPDSPARQALIEATPEAAVVSTTLPLRANLSVLENIALVPQFLRNVAYETAADQAWNLLARVGFTACAGLRDPDLSHEERFIAKLLRSLLHEPPIILIDRPALLLPDCRYPDFIETQLACLEDRIRQCWIVDYAWNAPLYTPR